MNSALLGVSSSLCCSHDLAGALLCSRLFGIQGMTPSLGWSHSAQCGESESSAWYPVLPSCPPATRGSAVHGDPHLGNVLCCWDPLRPMYHWETAPLPQAVEETMQVVGLDPSVQSSLKGWRDQCRDQRLHVQCRIWTTSRTMHGHRHCDSSKGKKSLQLHTGIQERWLLFPLFCPC